MKLFFDQILTKIFVHSNSNNPKCFRSNSLHSTFFFAHTLLEKKIGRSNCFTQIISFNLFFTRILTTILLHSDNQTTCSSNFATKLNFAKSLKSNNSIVPILIIKIFFAQFLLGSLKITYVKFSN